MLLFLKVEHDAYWLIERQPLGLFSYFLQTDEQQNLFAVAARGQFISTDRGERVKS